MDDDKSYTFIKNKQAFNHDLRVIREIAPGMGFWYSGFIDGRKVCNTGGFGPDDNTADKCMEMLVNMIIRDDKYDD